MEALKALLQKYTTQIETIGAVLIALVVAFFGVSLVVKAIAAFGNGKRDDGLKNLGWLVAVVLLGLAGYAGLKTLIKSFAPSSDILPTS